MKVMLLVLALLVALPEVAMSGRRNGAIWRVKTVVVRDHLPLAWQPFVEQTIDAFNEMLPKRAPKLTYERKEVQPCSRVGHRRGTIGVCEGGTKTGEADIEYRRDEIVAVVIRVDRYEAYEFELPPVIPDAQAGILCHELMHALTDIDDDYNYPHEQTSCVQGGLTMPGEFDRHFAHRVYKKLGHDSGPRDRNGRKH